MPSVHKKQAQNRLVIGRTQTSKGHVAGLVIGRTQTSKGHVAGLVLGEPRQAKGTSLG